MVIIDLTKQLLILGKQVFPTTTEPVFWWWLVMLINPASSRLSQFISILKTKHWHFSLGPPEYWFCGGTVTFGLLPILSQFLPSFHAPLGLKTWLIVARCWVDIWGPLVSLASFLPSASYIVEGNLYQIHSQNINTQTYCGLRALGEPF